MIFSLLVNSRTCLIFYYILSLNRFLYLKWNLFDFPEVSLIIVLCPYSSESPNINLRLKVLSVFLKMSIDCLILVFVDTIQLFVATKLRGQNASFEFNQSCRSWSFFLVYQTIYNSCRVQNKQVNMHLDVG